MKENTIYLTDVNAYITCVLCKGYLIDATTITECLHTCNFNALNYYDNSRLSIALTFGMDWDTFDC